jgi:hypothetical protein
MLRSTADAAAALLRGVPAGPAQEMLARQAGDAAATSLGCAASDETMRRLLNGQDVHRTVTLIALLTSGPLLLDFLARDHRPAVRRAVLAHPALPADDAAAAAADAYRRGARKLGDAIVSSRHPQDLLRLAARFPDVAVHYRGFTEAAAAAFTACRDEQLLLSAATAVPASAALNLVSRLCISRTLSGPAVLHLFTTVGLPQPTDADAEAVGSHLARDADDVTLGHALTVLPWPQLRTACVTEGRTALFDTVLSVAGGPDEVVALAAAMSADHHVAHGAGVAATVRSARAGLDPRLLGLHRQIRWASSAAHTIAAAAADVGIGAVHALRHPDEQVRAGFGRRLVRSYGHLPAFPLEETILILDGAAVEEVAGDFAWYHLSETVRQGTRLPAQVHAAAVARGPRALLQRLTLGTGDAAVLLARDDLDACCSFWAGLAGLTHDTDRELHHRILDRMDPADLITHPGPVDVTHVAALITGPDGQRYRQAGRRVLATLDRGPILDLLAPVVSVSWALLLRESAVMEAAGRYLHARLGDDTGRWETAVGLLTDWDGTLQDVAEAALAL